MKNARLLVTAALAAAWPTFANASITAFTNSIFESVSQTETVPGGAVNSLYSNGANTSFGFVNDPLTTTNFTGGWTTTTAYASASLNVNTSQALDITGNLNGYGDASYSGATNLYTAYGYAFDYLGFWLDAPGTVTVSYTGAVTNSITGSGWTQLTTNLDGNLVGPTGTWNVGAGSHYLQLYVQGRALAGYYSGNFYGSSGTGNVLEPFDVQVQSVPEPATVAILAIGLVSGIRRRRHSARQS